jgi:hypothetical protein
MSIATRTAPIDEKKLAQELRGEAAQLEKKAKAMLDAADRLDPPRRSRRLEEAWSEEGK